MLTVVLGADELQPLVRAVVRDVLAAIDADHAKLGDRLAFTEPEAAQLLGLARHQLRDARLRGEIRASRVGKRLLYSRDELASYLDRRRE